MIRDLRILFWLAVVLVVILSAWVLRFEGSSPPDASPSKREPVAPVPAQKPDRNLFLVENPAPPPEQVPNDTKPEPQPSNAGVEMQQYVPSPPGPDDSVDTFPLPGWKQYRREAGAWVPVHDNTPYYVRSGFGVRQIAFPGVRNEAPALGDAGLLAWRATLADGTSAIMIQAAALPNGQVAAFTAGQSPGLPVVRGRRVVWTALAEAPLSDTAFTWHLHRAPGFPDVTPPKRAAMPGPLEVPGLRRELYSWSAENGLERLTVDDRLDRAPALDEEWTAWEKHHEGPFGGEIMLLRRRHRQQLTENFYFDQTPQIHRGRVTWAGWDGNDFEIFAHDAATGVTRQFTENDYDDMNPQIWRHTLVWESFEQPEPDIMLSREPGTAIRLSANREDDFGPRIWERLVVWQGFDGEDLEIYLFDGKRTIKLTNNDYDDTQPDVRDGLVCWTGFADNEDAEVFIWNGASAVQLTDNDFDDENPRTAGGRVAWQAERDGRSYIYLAGPVATRADALP